MRVTLSRPKAERLAKKAGLNPAEVSHAWHRGDRVEVTFVMQNGDVWSASKGGQVTRIAPRPDA